MTDYTGETFHALTSFKGQKNRAMYVSPEVVSWVCDVEKNFNGKPDISCISRRQESEEQRRAPNEIGIAGLVCTVQTAKRLYNRKKRLHGVKFEDMKRWAQLKFAVQASLRVVKASPSPGKYWGSTLKGPNKQKDFLKIFRLALKTAKAKVRSKRYRLKIPSFHLKWIESKPEDIAAYDPNERVLHVHKWAAENFRRCDIVVLALHEILGHHLQEMNHNVESSQEAESCGMKCETLISMTKWYDPEAKRYCDLGRSMHEWRLFRLVRAQVDLRLHSKEVKKVYPKSAHFLWYVHPALHKYICPAETEVLRCASIPAQAQTYVHLLLRKQKNKAIKFCQC
jgi:hypothetical protein